MAVPYQCVDLSEEGAEGGELGFVVVESAADPALGFPFFPQVGQR